MDEFETAQTRAHHRQFGMMPAAKVARTSIRKKLMRMLLLTSVSGLVLAVVSFTVNDWISLQSAMFDRLHAQASIIGNNTIAALIFDDPGSARDTLDSLKYEGDIVGAALFLRNGDLFAYYERERNTIPRRLPEEPNGTLGGDFYVVSPVMLDRETLGSILVVSDLNYWAHRQWLHLLIALVVFILSLFVAWLISSRLQRLVSEPILKLAETARRVSEEKNYELRAEKISTDEIGSLVDDFNGMLRQIQIRDRALIKARDELEDKVQLRTLELTEITRQLQHQAYHDTLTGLANRVTFEDHLRLAADQARRHGHRLAVMFLDLDRFKTINDTLGHTIGDGLLVHIAKRLKECLRDSDTLARLGGDEFAVLVPKTRTESDAAEVANKLISVISEPVTVDGYNLHVTTSVGISIFPDDGQLTEVIVKNADTAMYRSKDCGGNQFTFFSADMNTRSERRLALEIKLRKAVRENALSIEYQPRRDAVSQELIGFEALARWFDPDEGQIAPADFIPLAEECGLIASIDEWVLENACREMQALCSSKGAGFRLSVNLSPAQFIRENFHEVVEKILRRTGFPGNRLEFEITESLFGPGSDNAYRILGYLRDLGIELSIDDFGTAFSSLSRLKQLPLHTLKIDQSFVRTLGQDPEDEILVRTIITMAHNLNLKVVAEGVETEIQYRYVKRYGCDSVQGFLFGRPIPCDWIGADFWHCEAQKKFMTGSNEDLRTSG